MAELKKKSNYKFWHSPIALGLLFIVLVFFGYNIIDLIKKERETATRKELILEQIDSLNKKTNSLSTSISRLNTDEGKEEVIREKYQVAKPNEKMVTIIEEENKDSNLLIEEEKSHGFWGWVKTTFFGK